MIRRTFASLAGLALLAGCAATSSGPVAGTSAPAQTSTGAVTAADPRAQDAGMEMLRRGGSATDAAIATMLALTVVEPQSSGIGGGGFIVRADAAGTVQTYDGRETAPAAADPSWFQNDDGSLPAFNESVMSGLSVGVPGNVAAAALAHRQHGKLSWAELFEPAIALARSGFVVNERLHDYLARMPERAGMSEGGRAWLYDTNGQPLAAGTVARNETLARSLEAIAQAGPEAFYSGEFARGLAETVARATPHEDAMRAEDIAAYRAKERDPVCSMYRDHRICAMGPPTSGGIVILQMLGQLERFDLAALGLENPVTWHLFLESQRLAYADRELYLADSDYADVPVAGLLDANYIAARSALISADGRMPEVKAGKPAGAQALADGDEPEERGTSHIAAVDAWGSMISYTSTIEGPFGSGLTYGGFYLNNELTDFSRAPEVDGMLVANRVEGGKRPRSSMAPAVVFDPQGRPLMAVGAAGGATIPVQTARSIIAVIDFGLPVERALGLPFIMGFGDRVMVEEGTWLETAIPALEALGHEGVFARAAPVKGGAILRTENGWVPARDPRLGDTVKVLP